MADKGTTVETTVDLSKFNYTFFILALFVALGFLMGALFGGYVFTKAVAHNFCANQTMTVQSIDFVNSEFKCNQSTPLMRFVPTG